MAHTDDKLNRSRNRRVILWLLVIAAIAMIPVGVMAWRRHQRSAADNEYLLPAVHRKPPAGVYYYLITVV
jgi:hypothetical protein